MNANSYRADAVNLARNVLESGIPAVTARGATLLANAVLEMDKTLLRLQPVLGELVDYLEQRQDIRDGSDRPLPNEEMTLLMQLLDALPVSPATGEPPTPMDWYADPRADE